MTERMYIYNPLFDESKNVPGGETNWINSVSGWGEFGGYLYSHDKSHAWYQKLGGFFEFFRISDNHSLSALSNIEFIADPHNDINFNPRAIFWEEAIIYTSDAGEGYWQAGYYHRCKHDIDNLDIHYERSLIYGSIMGSYIHQVISKKNTIAYAAFKVDFYTVLQDYRNPYQKELAKPVAGDLSFSAAVNFSISHSLSGLWGVYFSSCLQLNCYSTKDGVFKKLVNISDMNINSGVETGISLQGGGNLRIALRYEYFRDSGFNIIPAEAKLLSLGISFLPFGMF